MKVGRDAFRRAFDADYRRAIESAAESFGLVATTQECQKGRVAFIEKRPPKYTGR
jgi:enoyl-CoA hydratase